jgi:hypothetical protein
MTKTVKGGYKSCPKAQEEISADPTKRSMREASAFAS